MIEAGVPDFTFTTWLGLFAPEGTRKPIIDRLNIEATTAIGNPKIKARLVELGFVPETSTPEALAARNRAGFERVGKVIRNANIRID